ncbi:hypothetical protein CPB86DRAFT_733409 [Serendipita vermifera]|nr:hypothetical protein CPB86DRAFT_733409 [Serendipita vermifera]
MISTCCWVVPIRAGAVTISVIGVLASGAFGVAYAKEIEDGMMNAPADMPAAKFVPYLSMGSWVVLALISLFGCVTSWTAKPKLARIYFWSLVVHFIFDLGFLVATYFFCLKTVENTRNECLSRAAAQNFTNAEALCPVSLTVANIILLSVLVLYKLFSTFALYVIYRFMRWSEREAQEKEAQRIMQARPQQKWVNYDADTTRNWSKFED